jgi:phosphatidylinositol alpha-mannosyltransferase
MHYTQTVTVGTFHATRGRSWGYWFWKPICLNRWFERLAGRIAVSKVALDFISKYFPGDYTIIPNGIDLKHFSVDVAPIEEYSDGKLNILFVGRLEKRKGLKYLLGAYVQVKEQFPNSRLIVVGPNGGWRKGHERFVEKQNLKDVVFTDYVSYEDLPRYYHTADIFCSPATERESFGLVLLEAMAAAKPIIASDIEGYASVISHGVDGLLVPPKDEQALAQALSQLLRDEPLRQRLGAMGRRKVEDYSWESIAHKVMDYYQSQLEGK